MKSKLVVILVCLPLVSFFILEALFGLQYLNSKRNSYNYILPNDFLGWATIEWGNPDCPKLELENEVFTISTNAKGYYCTQDDTEKGWAEDNFHFASRLDVNLKQNPKTHVNWIWNEGWFHFDTDTVVHAKYPNALKKFYVFYVGDHKLKKDALKEFTDQAKTFLKPHL